MSVGGSDGRLRIWEDVSGQVREAEERQRSEAISQQQRWTNLVTDARYREALTLSLQLARPMQ
jgi:hypothetical protein